MIDIVEVASIVVLVRVPAPTLNQHDNPGSIATSVGAINFSQVYTGIGRSTHSVGTRQMMRSDQRSIL